MENNANLSDGARQADTVSSEHAETMFSADQAETNMVKLVDGKLVAMGDTEDDVSDDMPRIRLGSDEERALTGDDKKKYENSDAALRAGTMFDPSVMPDDPIAVGDITGNPDAGSAVNTGLPSEDESPETKTNSFNGWNFIGGNYPSADMIPQTPGTPDPMQPVPGIPETPPAPPVPGPEIPDLPGSPNPTTPEIQEPDQPDRSHEINAGSLSTFTSGLPSVMPPDDLETSETVAGTAYQGAAAGPDDEGMEDKPDTGNAARPYDVNAKDTHANQPGERPEEAKEAQNLPRELADESSVTAQDMISGPDRSDQKSTEGLDRKYNDPQAARDMAS
ncbi:hypothetical protein [Spirosoma sp.]|uniref:hypothetical protein n=1 Tax=Spirosoma sp. TaxID=1899569 RepID=UPI00263840FA|nr:hypothetical protein [Spirosoma sp.]MCX6214256.1 hypothetical protein [Spirosoma sp.]